MDLTELFCDVDDFVRLYNSRPLPSQVSEGRSLRHRPSRLSMSEIMTILIWYHQSFGYKNFKGYYQQEIQYSLRSAFPNAVSYQRFVDLIPRVIYCLSDYLQTRKGEVTGVSFIDSTPLRVCQNLRIPRHKVFQGIAQRGKTSTGWFYGFKLHLIVNDQGELLSMKLTPGNVDDRVPVEEMSQNLEGKLFGDRGYISKKLAQALKLQNLELITTLKKKMKPKVLQLWDRLVLRKRAIIETINDQLKNIANIEHSRHRSPVNAIVHIMAGLAAYSFQEKKPKIQWTSDEIKQMQLLIEENQSCRA